jgi:hypothetical protein
MKKFEVTLAKSYIVYIEAENEGSAKELTEFFTSDISNISNSSDENEYHFKILDIRCGLNEAIDAKQMEK